MFKSYFSVSLVGLMLVCVMSCDKKTDGGGNSSDQTNFEKYKRPKNSSSSAYISEVFEYYPAPGQFINESMGSKESAFSIIGDTTGIVTLGAWGGSIIFGFDHTIMNEEGNDLVIAGNATSYSSEPGIVQVSFDANGNGKPDDLWYEVYGDKHTDASTIKNYSIRYVNEETDSTISFEDDNGNYDTIFKPSNHKYYPQFIDATTGATYTGTRLPDNHFYNDYWQNSAFVYGYVDNYDNTYKQYGGTAIDLDWAKKVDGSDANIEGIDFVRVYTGINQACPSYAQWALGEVSTEVGKAYDISMGVNP